MGKCLLCEKDNVGLIRGHIAPNWIYSLSKTLEEYFLFGTKGQDEFIFKQEKLHRSKLPREKMFCNTDETLGQGCDQRIGTGEAEIKEVFIDGIKFKNLKGRFPNKIIEPTNFSLLTRGIAGILLKCFVSTKFRLTEHFSPSDPMIDVLKRAVNDDDFSSKVIKFAVVKYYRPKIQGVHLESAYFLNLEPTHNKNLFFLNFAGLLFIVYIDINSNIASSRVTLLAKPMPIRDLSLSNSQLVSSASIGIGDEEFAKDQSFYRWADPKEMINHTNLFARLIDPKSHNLLDKSWFKEYTRNIQIGCICGNRNRIFETCCKQVWKL